MAPRANWKGYLKLSLVSCPVALYPATSESEKVRFHRINRATGNRIKLQNVDAGSGEPVERDEIARGYEVSKGHLIEVTDEELDAVAIDSSRTIEIDEFVPRSEIDPLYNIRPYYITPDGDAGVEAFAVIREAMANKEMVALGRVVLSTREHVIALEPRGKGLMGTLLRYPYEVRDDKDYFDDIPDVKIDKEMLDLAAEIMKRKAGHFHPEEFEDRYQDAVKALLKEKQAGHEVKAAPEKAPGKVISIMDALRRSVEAEGGKRRKTPPHTASPPLQPRSKSERRTTTRKRAAAGSRR